MKRCLIVEDSSVIRKVAKRILASVDMLVAEAATGVEAIDICAHEMPDVVMVDYSLPDMDPMDLISQLMALNPEAKPHILLCTCEFDIGPIMRAKRAGAKGHIMKPFTRAQLLEGFREFQTAA